MWCSLALCLCPVYKDVILLKQCPCEARTIAGGDVSFGCGGASGGCFSFCCFASGNPDPTEWSTPRLGSV